MALKCVFQYLSGIYLRSDAIVNYSNPGPEEMELRAEAGKLRNARRWQNQETRMDQLKRDFCL
jgi:hypothetical protein